MIGLTGGIATGKSTVAKMLAELGAFILDADTIAKEVVEPKTKGWQEVAGKFPEVILPDQSINRKKLANIIFSDPQRKKQLENIIHPLVIDLIKVRGNEAKKHGEIVIADIPLLFETNSQEWLDEVWLVYADYQTQLQRLVDRDKIDKKTADKRIKSQLPMEEKLRLADRVIDTSYDRKYTKKQVEKLWEGVKNR